MSEPQKSVALLKRVEGRLRTASLLSATFFWLLTSAGVSAGLVLCARLLGLIPPGRQQPMWLLVFPALAIVTAVIFHRRIARPQAARAIDAHANTRDLFLTLATLDSSAGEYQPLVARSAEQAAEGIRPQEVVPFRFSRPFAALTAAIGAVVLLTWLLPQFDPFGRVEAVQKQDQARQQLADIARASQSRREQLQSKARISEDRSEDIDREIRDMMSNMREMKPREKAKNGTVLSSHRNSLNDQWKMVNNEELREMLSQQMASEQFGSARGKQMNEWLRELQNGESGAMQKQIEEAQEDLQAMLEAKTPEDRQKLASSLRRKLQDMKKFSSEKASSPELSSALDKALKALDAMASQQENGGQPDELSEAAAEALRESLELSKAELQELARNAKDLKQLEEAIRTLQQAEQLNREEQLDGEECEGCQTLAEYREAYRRMLGQNGEPGPGGSGEGFGEGGAAEEDDSDPEGYKEEKSKTQIQPGKVLMSIKTKEAPGERDFDPEELRQYQSSVQAIKSGVQAAIESEQIPPGYVDGIKGYFDNLESVDPEIPAAGAAPDAGGSADVPAESTAPAAVEN